MKKSKSVFIDVPRSGNETIRVSLDEFKGHHGVSIRIWFQAETGELQPSGKGLWIPIQFFADVAKGVRKIGRRARKAGLLPPRKERKGR